MKNLRFKLTQWLLILTAVFWANKEVNAQCIPPDVLSSTLCANSPVQFQVNSGAQGTATNVVWTFDGNVDNSGNMMPTYSFQNPGTYQVTLSYTDASGNPCTRSISITILPPPTLKYGWLTDTVQCFRGNRFTFIDSSTAAPGSFIRRVKYVAAGLQIDQLNPTMPFQFSFSTADPAGGFYDVDIEIEDANGCILVRKLVRAIQVLPDLGLNFTSNQPIGCNCVNMVITNNSLIPQSQVSSFVWNFGNGNTNTTNWGPTVNHTFCTVGPNNGAFTTCLTVTATNGCVDSFCFPAAATNFNVSAEIQAVDSVCFSNQPVTFNMHFPGVPPQQLPTGTTGYMWNYGNPAAGPPNINITAPITNTFTFTEPGPYLVSYTLFHQFCPPMTFYKQIMVLGPQTGIPGPGIPINQRYQCRSIDTVFFPNGSLFFHNDSIIPNDAGGYPDTVYLNPNDSSDIHLHWKYYFDSTPGVQSLRFPNLPNRLDDCIFRVWDLDDPYAPRCTTDHKPFWPQRAEYQNMHMAPDPVTGLYPRNTYDANGKWINCRYSFDENPKHFYTDWDTIYRDSFYLPNVPFQKTLIDMVDSVLKTISVDTNSLAEHRDEFFNQIPRTFFPRLYNEDTCHAYNCKDELPTPIVIMRPRSSGLQKEGKYCFGGPPNYGVTFNLSPGTRPGTSQSEAIINPDTFLGNGPGNWINYLPGGLSGVLPSPAPILPYAIAGPYPNQLFRAYPNPGSIFDNVTGFATVGLIIGNGTNQSPTGIPNLCYDTTYYDSFLKFPIIDEEVDILFPVPMPGFTNLFKVCKGDSLVISVPETNKTIPWDVDQISYTFSRIAPTPEEDGGRFPTYSYTIFENYEWFVPNADGTELENFLNRNIIRTYGNNSETILSERFSIGTVQEWIALADISQVFPILDLLFDSRGLDLSKLTPKQIADVFAIGAIDTTGLGENILYTIIPIKRTSTHFRDTSIFPLDTFGDPSIPSQNAYTFFAEENGIFDLTFLIRSKVDGCLVRKVNRAIVGFYNRLSVTDSIICKDTEIEGTPFFRYFHIDPELNNPSPCQRTWMDCVDWWTNREPNAGQPKIEGFTKWDWSEADDDPNNPSTIFAPNPNGTNPYGTFSYSPVVLGGTGGNKIYYNDSGIYKLRIAASDSTGCQDTLSQNIYVTRLFSNFGFKDTVNACVNIITFFDSTILVDPCPGIIGRKCDEISEWHIDWGDGKRPDFFNKQTYPPNLGFNIGHNYTRAGTFEVKFRVVTDLGCEDSITKIFVIAGPIPEFITDKLEVCSGDSIKFFNLSDRITNTSQWVWRFGDAKTRSELAPNQLDSFYHTYVYTGTGDTIYDAYLTMFDSVAGRFCGFTYPDTTGGSQQKIQITVKGKTPIYLFADKDTICPNDVVRFSLHANRLYTLPADPDYLNFFWNFDAENGLNDTLTSPLRIITKQFTDKGSYMITADGFFDPNINKCPASDTIFVFVDDVKADFDIDSSKAPEFCFTNKSSNSIKNEWGFYHTSDIVTTGEPFRFVEENNDNVVCRNFFDSLGSWFVCLTVENSGGCLDTICKPITFNRKIEIPNVFTPPVIGTSGDNLNDVFDIPIAGHDMYELVIRNRWGDIVFKSDDSEYDWNGQVNNDGATCPDGEYIYIFKYRFKGTEEVHDVNGIVVLIRQR